MGEGIPDLTDYPKRLVQLNDLFATNEGSWDKISREDLIHYLTTMLLWHELEHIKDGDVESKCLEFRIAAVKPKTMIWLVISKKRGDILGQISWYGPWRQYAFFPASSDVLFNAECLGDIKAFLENEMRKRKKSRK